MADNIKNLGRRKKNRRGFAFSADGAFQRECEDAFEFVENTGSAHRPRRCEARHGAPAAHGSPACGDGATYGKNGSSHARASGRQRLKQVAVLAGPNILRSSTTNIPIAARLFPVEDRVPSAASHRARTKDVLSLVETGQVDSIIGTHRRFQDVKFHELGCWWWMKSRALAVATERLQGTQAHVTVLTLSPLPFAPANMSRSPCADDERDFETPPIRSTWQFKRLSRIFRSGWFAAPLTRKCPATARSSLVHNRRRNRLHRSRNGEKPCAQGERGGGHGKWWKRNGIGDVQICAGGGRRSCVCNHIVNMAWTFSAATP